MPTIPAAEWETTPDLVRGLLAEQCPTLAHLPVSPFTHGWDNDMFRLGDALLVRLPRRAASVLLIEHEARWLPTIAARVTRPLPRPVFVGRPSAAFAHPWTVVPVLPGVVAADVPLGRRTAAAEGLADFLRSLHTPAPADAPLNPFRGGPLDGPGFHDRVLERVARHGERDALARRWEAWSRAPAWPGPALWLHGDAHPLNLLLDGAGRLAGVIDWGDLTSGDPACDLASAWLLFEPEGRRRFLARARGNAAYDRHVWLRARAWALHLGLIFSQLADDMPRLRQVGELALGNVLAEPAGVP